MSTSYDDRFIEDLYNAWLWTTYYDVIIWAFYGLLFFKTFNRRLKQIAEIHEKYL